jgi:hypothetical protein
VNDSNSSSPQRPQHRRRGSDDAGMYSKGKLPRLRSPSPIVDT